MKKYNTLRLLLGDQLNPAHSWFKSKNSDALYVMMETRSETDYAWHHIQKVCAFFAAMEEFATLLRREGIDVLYVKLDDTRNRQSITQNCKAIIDEFGIGKFEYQLPDEYRIDRELSEFCKELTIPCTVYDTEHFYTTREELSSFFNGQSSIVMEYFYREMRRKHNVLMDGNTPVGGKWNYDIENRKKIPKTHRVTPPLLFSNNVSDAFERIQAAGVVTIGTINQSDFPWPVNRKQSLVLLDHFLKFCLPFFGSFQDSMKKGEWSLYHSRLSFCMNVKLISPGEVVTAAIEAWKNSEGQISLNQIEGFVRQILGWREYMRGMYWLNMPDMVHVNFFDHQRKLPDWYWTGKTRMACLKSAIDQSLTHAYAHHIQRLMITGAFALLAGVKPSEVDFWYLSIYIDAVQWVELPNTVCMSQYADGGIVASKPYVASANYIGKMSDYCDTCYYDRSTKTESRSCPFNSLYWNFYARHREKLASRPRLAMVYKAWDSMQAEDRAEILKCASKYIEDIESL